MDNFDCSATNAANGGFMQAAQIWGSIHTHKNKNNYLTV